MSVIMSPCRVQYIHINCERFMYNERIKLLNCLKSVAKEFLSNFVDAT